MINYSKYTPLLVLTLLTASTHVFAAKEKCEDSTVLNYDCHGWYGGIGMGFSVLEPVIINAPEALDQTSDIVLPTLYVGYDTRSSWSFEGHYSQQGQATFESGAAIDYSHLGVSALYRFGEHIDGWNTYLKGGVSSLFTDVAQERNDDVNFVFEQANSVQIHFGAGFEYTFKNAIGLRAEALFIDKDSKEFTFSVFKRFNRNIIKIEKPQPVLYAPPKPKSFGIEALICRPSEALTEGIFFLTGSSVLAPVSKQVIDEFIELLPIQEQIEIEVRAHTDDRGPAEKNLKLSQDRAQTVKAYLESKGVTVKRALGMGETEAIAPNSTAAGREKNRRVEIDVLNSSCR